MSKEPKEIPESLDALLDSDIIKKCLQNAMKLTHEKHKRPTALETYRILMQEKSKMDEHAEKGKRPDKESLEKMIEAVRRQLARQRANSGEALSKSAPPRERRLT